MEKIVLGIDPGTTIMGYGVIQANAPQQMPVYVLQYGVIRLEKYKDPFQKLKKIFDRVSQVIREYQPDEIALEAPFFGKNVQSMLKLGRAQGVAMAAALQYQIPVIEYAPRKIKQAVTGNGNASKEQVAKMLESLLVLPETEQGFKSQDNQFLDATDALSVAICHFFQNQNTAPQYKNWDQFIKNNPNRLK